MSRGLQHAGSLRHPGGLSAPRRPSRIRWERNSGPRRAGGRGKGTATGDDRLLCKRPGQGGSAAGKTAGWVAGGLWSLLFTNSRDTCACLFRGGGGETLPSPRGDPGCAQGDTGSRQCRKAGRWPREKFEEFWFAGLRSVKGRKSFSFGSSKQNASRPQLLNELGRFLAPGTTSGSLLIAAF